MKTSKKAVNAAYLIYGILLILLNLIIFAVFKPLSLETTAHKVVFWFSYAFIIIAFVLQFLSIMLGRFESGVESIFFGLPLFNVSLLYFVITLVLSLAFMILVSFGVKVPFMLMFVLEVIALGLYLIAFIISLTHRNIVMEIDRTIKRNVFAIRSLVSDVECLAEATTDSGIRAKLNRLAEDIRYSDPMTNASVADLEMEIRDSIAELEFLVANGDSANIEAKIMQTQLLVSKRNKRLANGK